MRLRRLLIITASAAALAAAGAVPAGIAAERFAGGALASQERPNIVFIYTDDQELASFTDRYMPRTRRLLGGRGTEFEQFVVSTPLCCPSRVSYLTGQYPHNNGVFSNRGGYANLIDKRSTLASWLGRAGYRTAWIGRWLHGYQDVADVSEPAPGWDQWYASLSGRYYDYSLGINGRKVHFGNSPRDYGTHVLTSKAVGVVERHAPRPRPLFMTVEYPAPHRGAGAAGRCAGAAVPAPRDRRRFEEEPLPQPPSFNEQDVDDKPQGLRRASLGDDAVRALQRLHGCRLASLLAVDRGVEEIYEAIEKAGDRRKTVFIFTSDNGYLLGEHRREGKGIAYEEAIRAPLVVRAPKRYLGGAQVSSSEALVANVDLAPTILDLAGGVRPCRGGGRDCRRLDGRSLVPLLRGRSPSWAPTRTILLEAGKGGEPCLFRGVRTPVDVYIEQVRSTADGAGCEPAGEPEYYDLVRDPFELDNRVVVDPGPAAARRAELAWRLAQLRDCSGASCR